MDDRDRMENSYRRTLEPSALLGYTVAGALILYGALSIVMFDENDLTGMVSGETPERVEWSSPHETPVANGAVFLSPFDGPTELVSLRIPMPARYEHRREHAVEAERWYIRGGVGDPVARLAMLANAWHESKFDPVDEYRERDGSVSRGFHMVNTRGAGRGLSRRDALTVRHNVAAIMRDYRFAEWYRAHKSKRWDAGTSAYWFARMVERCASRYWNDRRVTANAWSKQLAK